MNLQIRILSAELRAVNIDKVSNETLTVVKDIAAARNQTLIIVDKGVIKATVSPEGKIFTYKAPIVKKLKPVKVKKKGK